MKKSYGFLILIYLFALNAKQAHAQNDNFELRILHNIQEHRTDGKTSFYKIVSGSTTPICIATPLTFFITGMIEHNNDLKKKALFITESIIISRIVSFSTKIIVNRQRPSEYDPTIIALTSTNNRSFPSGHTTAAFSTATSLAIISSKWYVIIPAYTWASLVGYSRLYLGVHYPSDILGGAILGSGSAWLSYKLNKWMHSKSKHHTTKPTN